MPSTADHVLIVDAQEPTSASGARRSLALATVVTVVLVFAATLDPVQRTARTALGLVGLVPLAVTMAGQVTNEDGAPVVDAFVRVGQSGELATTRSDETGSYRLTFTVRTGVPATVSVGATGYDASLRELRIDSTEPRFDARIHTRIRIDAGETTHLVVASDDGLCYPVGTDGSRSWPCRLVHVSVADAGVLNVAVVPDDPRDRFGVAIAVGSQPTLLYPTPCCPSNDAARLGPGPDTVVQIVALDLGGSVSPGARSRQGFTLRTALDPP